MAAFELIRHPGLAIGFNRGPLQWLKHCRARRLFDLTSIQETFTLRAGSVAGAAFHLPKRALP
jgi:hypothetical protein